MTHAREKIEKLANLAAQATTRAQAREYQRKLEAECAQAYRAGVLVFREDLE